MTCNHCQQIMQPVCPKCGGAIPSSNIVRTRQQQDTFHKLCASWAVAAGQSAAWAKIQFKFMYGVWVPFPFRGDPPPWTGRHYVVFKGLPDERRIFMKSEAEYTVREERALIEGARTECFDIGADIEWFEKMQEASRYE